MHMPLKGQFNWLILHNVATHVAGNMLHYVTLEKSDAALQESFRKVEPSSTSRNNCGNTKVARNVCCRVCYTTQFFTQLMSQ